MKHLLLFFSLVLLVVYGLIFATTYEHPKQEDEGVPELTCPNYGLARED